MSRYSKEFILLLNHGGMPYLAKNSYLQSCPFSRYFQSYFDFFSVSTCLFIRLLVFHLSVPPSRLALFPSQAVQSVSQSFILVGHILGLFPCFLCLFVLSLSVSQSDTVHKFIRQIVKPSVCLSIFLFVFAILLVCLLAIHLVCKILVTLY